MLILDGNKDTHLITAQLYDQWNRDTELTHTMLQLESLRVKYKVVTPPNALLQRITHERFRFHFRIVNGTGSATEGMPGFSLRAKLQGTAMREQRCGRWRLY